MSECRNCKGTRWVCENHRDAAWEVEEGCSCGAGAPCGACNLQMASAGYTNKWRELAYTAISYVESAIDDTNWGQPTFGPSYAEELTEIAKALDAPD